MKLLAVYLGGRAPRCNTELHDVVFVAGGRIEDVYPRLLELWFGMPQGLHVDAWMHVDHVDGYDVSLLPLAERPPRDDDRRLFFVNMGAYEPGAFTELHANTIVVDEHEMMVAARARGDLLRGRYQVHTDDLYDIDDILEVSEVDGYRVVLTPADDDGAAHLVAHAEYHVIPQDVIDAHVADRGDTAG